MLKYVVAAEELELEKLRILLQAWKGAILTGFSGVGFIKTSIIYRSLYLPCGSVLL
jgi:hypothetical protein